MMQCKHNTENIVEHLKSKIESWKDKMPIGAGNAMRSLQLGKIRCAETMIISITMHGNDWRDYISSEEIGYVYDRMTGQQWEKEGFNNVLKSIDTLFLE